MAKCWAMIKSFFRPSAISSGDFSLCNDGKDRMGRSKRIERMKMPVLQIPLGPLQTNAYILYNQERSLQLLGQMEKRQRRHWFTI